MLCYFIYFSPLYFLSDQTDAMWNIKSNHLANNLENVDPVVEISDLCIVLGLNIFHFQFF